jgi:hypothetical protein
MLGPAVAREEGRRDGEQGDGVLMVDEEGKEKEKERRMVKVRRTGGSVLWPGEI